MITFNIQANNSNYLCSHGPSNNHVSCWTGEECKALVFTIEQARELVNTWPGFLKIVIAVYATPISDEDFKHELFCAKGGSWYAYIPQEETNA